MKIMFKRRLRVYEEAEQFKIKETTDNVMKTNVRQGRGPGRMSANNRKEEDANVICYKCGIRGHKARTCYRKVWCGYCKNNTHEESLCKKKGGQDGVRKVKEEENSEQDQFFKAKHTKSGRPPDNVEMRGIMVDAGATSHIVNDIEKFDSFDDSFLSGTHSVE